MPVTKPVGTGGLEGMFNGDTMAGIKQKNLIGISCGYGSTRFGKNNLGDSRFFSGIYQKRVTGYNNRGRIESLPRRSYYVRMRTYRPTNPQTIPQQLNRSKFSEAVSEWGLLTHVEKSVYNERGKKRNKIGRNIFISEYMKNN